MIVYTDESGRIRIKKGRLYTRKYATSVFSVSIPRELSQIVIELKKLRAAVQLCKVRGLPDDFQNLDRTFLALQTLLDAQAVEINDLLAIRGAYE